MKRKLITLLLTVCTLSTLVACGNNPPDTAANENVQENVQENTQEDIKETQENQINQNVHANKKKSQSDWSELSFIIEDEEYKLFDTYTNYDLENKIGYNLSSIYSETYFEDMTIPARNKKDLTYSGVTDLSFYEDVSYNSLTSIRLSLTNIGDTDKILKDCEVFEFYIYVYDAMKKNEEYPYFSINGLKVGDSEETVLEKLGTNYTSKYERNNTTGYQYKIPEEDKFLEVDVSPEFGLYSFTIRQYPKAYVELKENIEDIKIEENIENIEENLSEENIPEVLPSENWEDMEVVINGNLIDLDNFSYQELTQLIGGRLADNYNDKTLKSEKQYMMSVWLYEEIDGSVKDSLTVNFYNPSNEEQLLKDCKINLIEQSLSDKEETKDNLIFSKGLTPGLEMSIEDVINLFGEPSEIDESKSYKELIYNAGNKKFIIRVKDNKINGITLSFKYEE